MDMFAKAPEEASARCSEAAPGQKIFTSGMYRLGGVVGVRTNARKHAELTAAACDLVRFVSPGFVFTSVAISRNTKAGLHVDSNNADRPNLLIPLSDFSGGEVFVEDPDGVEVRECAGQKVRGKAVPVASGPTCFHAKRHRHFTLSWEGERTVVVAFSVWGIGY